MNLRDFITRSVVRGGRGHLRISPCGETTEAEMREFLRSSLDGDVEIQECNGGAVVFWANTAGGRCSARLLFSQDSDEPVKPQEMPLFVLTKLRDEMVHFARVVERKEKSWEHWQDRLKRRKRR